MTQIPCGPPACRGGGFLDVLAAGELRLLEQVAVGVVDEAGSGVAEEVRDRLNVAFLRYPQGSGSVAEDLRRPSDLRGTRGGAPHSASPVVPIRDPEYRPATAVECGEVVAEDLDDRHSTDAPAFRRSVIPPGATPDDDGFVADIDPFQGDQLPWPEPGVCEERHGRAVTSGGHPDADRLDLLEGCGVLAAASPFEGAEPGARVRGNDVVVDGVPEACGKDARGALGSVDRRPRLDDLGAPPSDIAARQIAEACGAEVREDPRVHGVATIFAGALRPFRTVRLDPDGDPGFQGDRRGCRFVAAGEVSDEHLRFPPRREPECVLPAVVPVVDAPRLPGPRGLMNEGWH